MPELPRGCSGWASGFQPLKSAITETRSALGAHTANAMPPGATCAPSLSNSRKWLPSLNRYRSSSVSRPGGSWVFIELLPGRVPGFLPTPTLPLRWGGHLAPVASSSVHEAGETAKRDADPVRSVVELVPELVQGLLDQHDVQQEVSLVHVGRQEGSAGRRRQVGLHERLRGQLRPGRAVRDLDRLAGIGEGAQHPGHVLERPALEPPLAQRSRRLALEVDDDEVAAGEEHLPQVVVAVAADA